MLQYSSGLRRKRWSASFKQSIRLFTPAWHAIIMGTGAVTILFSAFPYHTSSHRGLQTTALCFLVLNLVFFVLISALTIIRYALFPRLWRATLLHPAQGLFLGCAPMGFVTILMGAMDVVYGYFGVGGRAFLLSLWAMWWIDVAVSVVLCFGQLHIMFTRQTHSLSRMTMIWLLPIVTLIVSSAAGALIAQSLVPHNLSYVYLTLGTCFLLVTIGITLSLAVMTIYVLRLAVYKVPGGIGVFGVYLPIGPLGQAGYTYVVLGEVASQVFAPSSLPANTSSNTSSDPFTLTNPLAGRGDVLNAVAWVLGFALWSFATCWVVLALLVLADVFVKNSCLGASRRKGRKHDSTRSDDDAAVAELPPPPPPAIPFKITFWGMIFPNGVYANLTIHLASTVNSTILRVWGTIYAVFTIALWCFAFVRTVGALKDGSVFEELVEVVQEQVEVASAGPGRGRDTRGSRLEEEEGDVECESELDVDADEDGVQVGVNDVIGGSRIEMSECRRSMREIESSV